MKEIIHQHYSSLITVLIIITALWLWLRSEKKAMDKEFERIRRENKWPKYKPLKPIK